MLWINTFLIKGKNIEIFKDCNELEYLILSKFNASNGPINNKELINKYIKIKKELSEIMEKNNCC